MFTAKVAAMGTLVSMVCLSFFWAGCGGGTDVGNPEIRGVATYENGMPAGGARVVLGRTQDLGYLDTTHLTDAGALQICFRSRGFDTAFCDTRGEFVFEDMPGGLYTILVSKDRLLGLENIEHSSYDDSPVSVQVSRTASISVENRGIAGGFVAARVAGTSIATACSLGQFSFDTVPSGDFDIIFYAADSTSVVYPSFTTYPGCSGSLLADQSRSPTLWQVVECGPRDWYGIPYILGSLPSDGAQGEPARVNYGKNYDVQLRFSHAMDVWTVREAITAVSSDSALQVDRVWFEGANMAYVTFCRKDSAGGCLRTDTLYRSDEVYSVVIDTSAQTTAGVGFAYPETLSFVPEPLAGQP